MLFLLEICVGDRTEGCVTTELERGSVAEGRVGGMDARSTAELVATCTAAATAAMLKATSLPVSE